MSKKFNEYNGLNLPEINREMRGKWEADNVFERTMTEREGCPSFVFSKGRLPPTASRASITCSRVQ